MGRADDREQVEPQDRADWRAWLAEHDAQHDGIWLVLPKARAPRQTLSYDDAVEEGLCFGWIDSVGRSVDEDRTSLLFTPRKRGSGWAATNKRRIERLEAAGLIAAPGRAVIEAAKADGSWTLLDDAEAGFVPADLADALAREPRARAAWDAFPQGARKAMLTWVVTAKRPETRAKRVAEIATAAAAGRRAGPAAA